MADAYLKLAEDVLRRVGKPLHVRNILSEAIETKLAPERLHGKTQHKTLAARLSEDIRKLGVQSKFIRTGPNRFFLRDLSQYSDEPIYHARRRAKSLFKENVLAFDVKFLRSKKVSGIAPNPVNLIKDAVNEGAVSWIDRRIAENSFEIKQAISYVIIINDFSILSYVRGRFTRADGNLYGMRSIGFGGHVTSDDMDFFSEADCGITLNAKRELCEELFFDKEEIVNLNSPNRLNLQYSINTEITDEARKHLGFVFIYQATPGFKAIKNELSINDPTWLRLPVLQNDLSEFEPWSAELIPVLNQNVRSNL